VAGLDKKIRRPVLMGPLKTDEKFLGEGCRFAPGSHGESLAMDKRENDLEDV
jgi:hypothetical protein